MKTVRIFLSSPGDVGAEREKAREIFERLQVEFSGLLEIAPYFWEHEPMRAHTDFQTQIEPPSKFDLFICLLWARLGSRLHPGLHRKADGSEYASGTEYELLDALEEFRRSKAPEVLIYKRLGDPVIPAKPKEERERILSQYDALESFFARLTQEDGHFVVGTNNYAGLEQFETKFENDMRKVLARFVPEGVAGSRIVPKSWTGDSPFRGLRHFDFEHAPIFFGRTRATDEVLAVLKRQAADERAFVLVFGGSGVGKSSLVRAGVLPWLVKPGVIDGVGLWRWAVMRPSEVNEGDLFDALGTALMRTEGLPEIGSDGTDVTELAAMLREKPEGVGMLIKGALSQAAREIQVAEKLEKQPRALFALAIDQLEELFTVERLASQREGFLRAIDALARSGYVWVLATLRSDFYPRCEESPLLMKLKEGAGQYHLQPPDEVQLGQMIRLPASAAGLLFEEDHKTGERLDDLLRDAGVKSPAALPLLEFALEELYEQRDQEKGLLKLEAYRALGGVEGALGKRAEESFQQASASAQESFDAVFRQLVTISAGEGEPAVRRRARKAEVEATAGAGELVDRLTTDRLLVADRTEEGVIVIGLAHEAMLASWPRLAQWVEHNRESLKVRAQVAADAARWLENKRNSDYLYDAGLPLEKARVAQREGFLDASEKEFVETSNRQVAAEASRRIKVLRWLAAVGVFAIIAVFTGVLAWQKKREADAQKVIAQGAKEKAVIAKKAAEDLISYMQYDLSGTLGKLGYLDLIESINARIRQYHKHHPAEAGDSDAERESSVSLNQRGEVLQAQGNLAGALQSYRDSLAIREKLANEKPEEPLWQHDLSISYSRVGNVLSAQGDLAGALQNHRASLAIVQKLAKQDAANTEWQRNLAVVYNDVGDVLSARGEITGALQSYRDSFVIAEKLAKQDPANGLWQRDVSVSYNKVGDMLKAQGDIRGALQSHRDSLAITEKLVKQDPANAGWQQDLSLNHTKLGDLLSAGGDLAGALQSYRESLAIGQKLLKQDPANAGWQRDLSLSYDRIGDALAGQGDIPGALENYQESVALREKLVQHDPGNTLWQRDLSVSHNSVGDLFRARGDLPGALQKYRASIAIVQKLTQQDPANALWQRDLSVGYNKLGDMLRAQGDLPAALQNYRDSLALREKLAQQDPANAGWQRDLFVSVTKVGDVLIAQGDLPGALKSYRESLAIAEKLAQQDPDNPGRQSDVSVSSERVGDVLLSQSDLPGALQSYRVCLAIFEKLTKQNPANAGWQRNLSVAHYKVGLALAQQGNLAGALESCRHSLAITEKLAALDPANADWQRDLCISLGRVAETILAMPKPDRVEARRLIAQALDIMAAFEKKGPLSSSQKQTRTWLEELREKTGVRR